MGETTSRRFPASATAAQLAKEVDQTVDAFVIKMDPGGRLHDALLIKFETLSGRS